jgi:hypothetical protein
VVFEFEMRERTHDCEEQEIVVHSNSMYHELSDVKTEEDKDPSETKEDALGCSDGEGIVSECHFDDKFG